MQGGMSRKTLCVSVFITSMRFVSVTILENTTVYGEHTTYNERIELQNKSQTWRQYRNA